MLQRNSLTFYFDIIAWLFCCFNLPVNNFPFNLCIYLPVFLVSNIYFNENCIMFVFVRRGKIFIQKPPQICLLLFDVKSPCQNNECHFVIKFFAFHHDIWIINYKNAILECRKIWINVILVVSFLFVMYNVFWTKNSFFWLQSQIQ